MARPQPVHWLSVQARTGLRELPSNVGWLLSKAVQPVEDAGSTAESVASGTRDKARGITASAIDIAPVGDSVEIRMK
jgi:hypothetical protein